MTTVLQYSYGWASEAIQYSQPTYLKLTKMYGLHYKFTFERTHLDRTPHWDKIVQILRWMNNAEPNDVLLYADTDTMVKDFSFDPNKVLLEGMDIGCVETIYNQYNTGLMFIRNLPIVRKLFELVDLAGPMNNKDQLWNEEYRFNNEFHNFVRKGLRIQTIPSSWNACKYTKPEAEHTIIKAWHGHPKDTTIREMKKEFEEMKKGGEI